MADNGKKGSRGTREIVRQLQELRAAFEVLARSVEQSAKSPVGETTVCETVAKVEALRADLQSLQEYLGAKDGNPADILVRLQDLSGRVSVLEQPDKTDERMGDLPLRQAQARWEASAIRARNAYFASWFVIVVLLVVIPIVAVWRATSIVAGFRAVAEAALENATGTATLVGAMGGFVLIATPVVLYAWLIQIVVQFNARSLSLMDDAQRRVALIGTYLLLVEHDPVAADRALVLNTLFRGESGKNAP